MKKKFESLRNRSPVSHLLAEALQGLNRINQEISQPGPVHKRGHITARRDTIQLSNEKGASDDLAVQILINK